MMCSITKLGIVIGVRMARQRLLQVSRWEIIRDDGRGYISKRWKFDPLQNYTIFLSLGD